MQDSTTSPAFRKAAVECFIEASNFLKTLTFELGLARKHFGANFSDRLAGESLENVERHAESFVEDVAKKLQVIAFQLGHVPDEITRLKYACVSMNWNDVWELAPKVLATIESFCYEMDVRANVERQQRTSVVQDDAVPLTANDRAILTAMLELEATSEKPETSAQIVGKALYRGDSKRAFVRLKQNKLINSKRGNAGGYWLTNAGIAAAKRVDS